MSPTRARMALPAAVLAVVALAAPPAAAQTWTGLINGSWNFGANWSLNAAPASGANTLLTFGTASATAMTQDINTAFQLNNMHFLAGGPAYTLTGGGLQFVNTSGATPPLIGFDTASTVTLGNTLTLGNNLTVVGSGAGTLTLNGSVNSANGNLTYAGAGTLTLGGSTDNFGLGVTVNSGTVVLAKTSAASPAVHAVGGSGLTIAGGTVRLGGTGGDQIFDSANVFITSGTLDTNGASESLNAMNLQGTGIGGNGALVNNAAGTTSAFTPSIALFLTGNATVGAAATATLAINGPIVGNFGLTKVGAGTLTLGSGSNTYSGGTVVNGGTLALGTVTNGGVPGPLGAASNAPANLVLGGNGGGGTLRYTGPTTTTDRGVTLAETSGFPCALEVTTAATNLTLTGQITGPGGLTKAGPGALTLTNTANNYEGGTFVNGGRLVLGDGDPILPPGSNVTVAAGAEFDTGSPSSFHGLNALGTLTLNGGTFRAAAFLFGLNQLVTGGAGGTVTAVGTSAYALKFENAGAGITINGNSSFTGAGSEIYSSNPSDFTITVAPNATLTNGVPTGNFRLTGGGTMYVTSPAYVEGAITVGQARLRVDDVTTGGAGTGTLGSASLTLDGGTLQYGGPTATLTPAFTLGAGGGTVEVLNAATTLTLTSAITGTGPFTKAGPGVLVLNNTSNQYVGITVANGRLDVGDDALLGIANPTVNALGTLRYTANATTARTFTLNAGALEVPSGVTLTLNGAAVGGGFLRGAGTFALTGGTTVSGATTFTGTTIGQAGAATFVNVTHGGLLTLSSGAAATLNGFTVTPSGRITVGSGATANVSEFQSSGQLNITGTGVLNNGGTSAITLGGGSVTSIGIYNPVNGQVTPGGIITLADTDMVIQGGLVRNNGTISSNNGNIIVDFGGVLRGSGVNDVNSVILRNGGQRFSGNSPGPSFNRNVDLTNQGVTGVDISRATGTAGTDWGVYEYGATSATNGRLTITGTPTDKAIFKMETVTDVAPRTASAPLADFDPLHPYNWDVFRPGTQNTVAQVTIVDALTNLTISGSQLNDTVLNEYLGFDASGWDWGTTSVAERGIFAFTLEPDTLGNANRVIALGYTPVPEPGTLALLGVAAFGLAYYRRQRTWPAATGST